MKICIVKHPYYPSFGWESARYKSPEQMLQLFRYKSHNLSFAIGMKIDMWVVEGMSVSPAFSLDTEAPKVFRALYKAQKTVPWSTIPWHEYDVVIAIDPIISDEIIRAHPQILWVYNEPSHQSGRAQRAARHGPLGAYDLFWDDYMRAPRRQLTKLPQPISFPYFGNPDIMRALIKPTNEGGVFIDSRHVVGLSKSGRASMVQEFQSICGIPVKHAPLDGRITHETRYTRSLFLIWGKMLKSIDYLKLLGSCKYSMIWRRKKSNGQAALEAASLGLVAIANSNAVYPAMLCHPTCLIPPGGPPRIGLRLIKKIEANPDWRAKILVHQDKMLWEKFWNRPLEILNKALEMKRGRHG